MIDKHELRLGNYALYDHRLKMKITQLTVYRAWGDCGFSVPCDIPYDDLEPIELTEDILLKCGFEKEGNNSYQLESGLGFILWSKTGKEVNIYYDGDELGETVKSLHHLQNVFYFLTGKELQIDLK